MDRVKRALKFGVALVALSFAAHEASAATYLRIQCWNARHMGWSGETDWSGYAAQIWNQFGSGATSANGCDVVALQEVMNDTSVTSLVTALETISGFDWAATYTGAIGRSSYKERYAVVYRTDRVTLLQSYTWNDVGDQFEREPQIVRLRVNATAADVTLINWHTIWGTSAQRQQEIQDIVPVFAAIQDGNASDQDVILLGDHNQSATSTWWNALKSTSNVSPAVTHAVNDLTTINSSCGYASAYDHFWLQTAYVSEYSSSGRDYVASLCAFEDGLSDHAPIWLKLYSNSDDD
jgi:endonuclease/exonuclease/phosphatase family metal-dependent hydrolase